MRYGLIPFIKQITFRLLKVKVQYPPNVESGRNKEDHVGE